MLKKIRGLFLGLVVLAGSACVTPTHASSAPDVVLSYIQAAGESGAKEEAIVIHNNTAQRIDITDWCLVNKADKAFACFDGKGRVEQRTYILPAYGDATVASHEYVESHTDLLNPGTYTLAYTVTSQSSGSIVSSADDIQLVDTDGEVRDRKEWTSSLSREKAWERVQVFPAPLMYAANGNDADWTRSPLKEVVASTVEVTSIWLDEELVDEGERDNSSDGVYITELLPNPAGVDAGKEFIEVYNSTLGDVLLNDYSILIGCGDLKKEIFFPVDTILLSEQYYVITNDTVAFTLPNTKGCVQLAYQGEPIGAFIEYFTAKDDMAWALLGDGWFYTAPTPGQSNKSSAAQRGAQTSSTQNEKKPCASNQFRNPETGRCKLIATTTTPTPCKANQERNPETGRCRAVKQQTSPAPCKEGQFRNPETGRCKAVVSMSKAGFGVKGVQSSTDNQPQWYYWTGIVGVALIVLGYAVWEWREELKRIAQKARGLFARRAQ